MNNFPLRAKSIEPGSQISRVRLKKDRVMRIDVDHQNLASMLKAKT
jgi:hypothetical protein